MTQVPSVPLINASSAVGVAELLRQEQIKPAPVFESAGLSVRASLDPYEMIGLDDFTVLLDIAAELSQRPLFGLELGMRQDPSKWGAYGYVLQNSPTVGTALANMAYFLPAIQEGTHCAYIREGNQVGIEYSILHPRVARKEQDAEISMAFVKHMVDQLTRRRVRPSRVAFEHPPLGEAEHYRHLLSVKPLFEQPINQILFPRQIEDAQVLSADLKLFPIVRKHLEDILFAMPDKDDLMATVRYHIRQILPQRNCKLEKVARILAVSSRTLQRRLGELETNFAELLDRERHEQALHHLESSDMSVKEISYLLDYYDPSAFVKAFRKWTGITPSQYRESVLKS